ncbi:MAG: hypothetical protein KA792_07140 [Bacteroidales bacterium]|nr:hypothetical protein [Bacteroidales bacterium]
MNYGITIERFKNYPEKSIFALTMFSLFLLPAFHISLLWFEIRMEDLCLPLVILVLIFNRFYIWDNYIKIILAFCLLILISIIVNNRLAKLSDYFEIYKNIKYLIYFIFLYICFINIDLPNIFI